MALLSERAWLQTLALKQTQAHGSGIRPHSISVRGTALPPKPQAYKIVSQSHSARLTFIPHMSQQTRRKTDWLLFKEILFFFPSYFYSTCNIPSLPNTRYISVTNIQYVVLDNPNIHNKPTQTIRHGPNITTRSDTNSSTHTHTNMGKVTPYFLLV